MACVKDNGAAGCSTQMKAVRRPAAAVVISIVARAIAKIAKHIAKSDVGQFPDQYRVLFFEVVFWQIWYNGLDSDRFCAPEHICELRSLYVLRF